MSVKEPGRFQFHWGVRIPLRDGIRLSATVYRPRSLSAPRPCVVTMTPYISDSHHAWGAYFAARGLPFAIVDVRGRGNSEGHFRPNIQEAKDGYDVVEWLAQQPYCDGQVAMCGGSYLGAVQWATAKEFPPHLATIVPAAAPYLGVDFPMRNNIFYPYIVQWLTLTSGRASQRSTFADTACWSAFFREWHESGKSFRELDALAGNPSSILQEWLDHPGPDAYWDEYNPNTDQYAKMELPILTITGVYDDDQPGALEHYQQYMRAASPEARGRHYLVIGPWDHGGSTGTPRMEFGGIKCGPESLLDLMKLHLEWFAWTLQQGPKPEFLCKPVAYYVMGAERWRYAETLEAITFRHAPYYLDSVANASDLFSSGQLTTKPGTGQPDSYCYDPREASGPEVAAEANVPLGSITDQTVVAALNGRQLIYHTAPYPEDIELSGFFRLSVWLAIDCSDTDFYVAVYEVGLDGGCIRLSTDGMRARYREGPRSPRLIRTLEPLRYDFERFTFMSRKVKRGHRLRLVIAPVGRLNDGAFTERNFNSGGAVADESMESARAVTVQLFHDADHPSALYIPLGHPESQDEPRAPASSLSSL